MGVRTEVRGCVAVVTLDWPDRRNAIGPAESEELIAALRVAATDRAVHGVVLTGNGAFCAGANVKEMPQRLGMDPAERRRLVYGAYQGAVTAVTDLPVPTVAAIDGAAVGLGLDIALACDAVLFGPDGWIMLGWNRLGLLPGGGGLSLLGRRSADALWRLLGHGVRMGGEEAERYGLGERVTPTALDAAVALVDSYAEVPRDTLEAYVRLGRAELRRALPDHQRDVLEAQLPLIASPEYAARVQRANEQRG